MYLTSRKKGRKSLIPLIKSKRDINFFPENVGVVKWKTKAKRAITKSDWFWILTREKGHLFTNNNHHNYIKSNVYLMRELSQICCQDSAQSSASSQLWKWRLAYMMSLRTCLTILHAHGLQREHVSSLENSVITCEFFFLLFCVLMLKLRNNSPVFLSISHNWSRNKFVQYGACS